MAVSVVAVLRFGLGTGRVRAVPILSGSMRPLIQPGDVAVLTPTSADSVRKGDVIIFHAPTGNEDLVTTGAGNDMVNGGEGADEIAGVDGDDTLIDGLGDDRLDGENGADSLDGGDGDDMCLSGETSVNCERFISGVELKSKK